MTMIQRRFYLPEETYTRLQLLAKSMKQNISQALREAVEEGLKRKYRQRRGNASALLNLAQIAETEGWGGPNDLATNHDKYFIDAWNRKKRLLQFISAATYPYPDPRNNSNSTP